MRYKLKQVFRVVFATLFIGSLFLISISTYSFFNALKSDELQKIKIWLKAQEKLLNFTPGDDLELTLEIINSNTKIPTIIVSEEGQVYTSNIAKEKTKDKKILDGLIEKYANENVPIIVKNDKVKATIYFGNTMLINQLKYYPVVFLILLLSTSIILFLFLNSIKRSDEKMLWIGMAKETAHQIGTPLSALIGWVELIKMESEDSQYITKMEQDIERLKIISNRFANIGSLPRLKPQDMLGEVNQVIAYIRRRTSDLVKINIHHRGKGFVANLETDSFRWAIENLIINAIDAIRGRGKIDISVIESTKYIRVSIKDSGKGISRKHLNRIFDFGFTTKKKGWGLGLSLVKRIVKDYHKAKITVRSKEGRGTIFTLLFRKSK